MLRVFCDGAAMPTNPGPAGAGAVGFRADVVAFEARVDCGWATNNVAEYTAAITGLQRAAGVTEQVLLFTDSKLVVEQYNGLWKCRQDHLKPLLRRLRTYADMFEDCDVIWIPRDMNEHADRLSREAIGSGQT